jgi:hypothetical protein
VAAGAVAGALALVSGCSQQTPSASWRPPAVSKPTGPPTAANMRAVQQAVARTLRLTTSVSYQLVGAQVFGTSSVSVTGSGAFDLNRNLGELSLTQPAGRQIVVITPTVVYSQVPAGGGGALPAGKSWMSASITGSESTGTNFPQFDIQVEGFNPVLYLDEIAWGGLSAAPLPNSSASGTPARGYLVAVDLRRAIQHAAGPSARSISLAIHSEITSLGTSSVVTVRLWTDSSGRAVMLQASPPGGGVGTTTIAMQQCCIAVHVGIPPLNTVVDLAQLTPAGEREHGGADADGV